MYTQGRFKILRKEKTARDTYDFVLSCEEIASAASPGQFVHISADGFFLRRPISICDIDKEHGTIRLVVQIRGKGTDALCSLCAGDKMDIMGPLGRGFKLYDKSKKAVVVGGGIGTPPMVAVAKHYKESCTAITGFRSKDFEIHSKDFKAFGSGHILCTDDGSAGKKGFVTDALSEIISKDKPDVIYACGPMVMLKAVSEMAKSAGIECQISLEERMACGVGACLGCAVKIIKDGEEVFGHVCKDGPVFDSREVVL